MVDTQQNIHQSFRFVIIIGQCFGIFPVDGVFSRDGDLLKFTWVSLRVFIALSIGTIAVFVCSMCHFRLLVIRGFSLGDFGGVIFNGCNGSHFFSFLFMARAWPKIVTNFKILDKRLLEYGYPKHLNLKLKIIACVFLTLELAEHLNVQVKNIKNAYWNTNSFDDGLRFYLYRNFPHIFQVFEYSHFKGIILQITNTCLACIWTYTDLFIILICYYIAERFRLISKRVKYMKRNQISSLKQWETMRKNYSGLSQMCRFINAAIANMLLMDFFTNLYFIITGLYIGFHMNINTVLAFLNFATSFVLLSMRSVIVCWCAGKVKEESEAPQKHIISLPSQITNIEVERMMNEIRYSCVNISGKGFFTITKLLILQIVGATLTYQLVMYNFVPRQKF